VPGLWCLSMAHLPFTMCLRLWADRWRVVFQWLLLERYV
jgi:hypothetical protein